MKNVTRGWKTTLIGLGLMAASVISVFTTKGTIGWMDASIGIGIGLALVFCPDSLLTKIMSLLPNRSKKE